ncbi:MAG: bifunctional DNA primase/polymerase [Planctomycetes bacterium]|nr:bifunctional DNA primase/polymerase [Planctomycetota bacterium]
MVRLLEAAQRYAELGYRVFPCADGLNPAPLTRHGFKDASCDPDQIASWWGQFPSACIGLAADGLLVIDVDGENNPWLTPERAIELSIAPTARTPRGGWHYVFRKPAGATWRCTVGQLAAQVDTRTDGGYIVVAPSRRPDGTYHWIAGSELDVPSDRLPLPPDWLTSQLDQLGQISPQIAARGNSDVNPIPAGQRNGTLIRLAGSMRRVGMSKAEIIAALTQVNRDRCVPSLSPVEVDRIAGNVTRYAPDQVATAIAENHWEQLVSASGAIEPLAFEAITSQQLDDNEYELEYLINGILVRGQPGVIAGPKKTLKTNISIDLALSLASGGRFLGHFAAEKEVRVGLMSGESGAATIQETARRIAVAKQGRLRDFTNVLWSFAVPQLGKAEQVQALERFITNHQLEVLILDPTYLMMLGLADQAGNLFVVGAFLKSLGDIAQATGCTPLLCHHLKKSIADPYEPAELENIAWAGFQEFVRQWVLLNRRARYDPDQGGHHELWMSVGGSAGHSGLWGLNIEEGTRQELAGRRWQVEVISAFEAHHERITAASEAADDRKQLVHEAKLERQRHAVFSALEKFPAGETSRVIRDTAGVGARAIQAVLDALVQEGKVVTCKLQKNKREELGYQLPAAGGPGGP